MMKKLLAVLSIALFSVAALAYSGSIIGKWGSSISNAGVDYEIYLEVSENVSKFGLICKKDKEQVQSEVTVATKIEGNVFHVLGSGSQANKIGDINCNINVKPVAYTFEASEVQLRLNTDDGRVLFLNRQR